MTTIKSVLPKGDCHLEVLFENGNSVVVNFEGRLKTIRFGLLADPSFFKCATTDGNLVTWNDKIEISASEILEMAKK